jgi:HK97 family phage major capsid protein
MLKEAETREGGLSGEHLTAYDAAEKDFDRLTKEFDARTRAEEIESRLKAAVPTEIGGEPSDEQRDAEGKKAAELRNRAFDHYLRRGLNRMPEDEQRALERVDLTAPEYRDLSDVTGSAGGFTIPQGFLQKITERQKYYGPMRLVANVIQTSSGQALPWPSNDDTGVVASVLAENVQISEADVTFGQRQLNAYVWTSGLVRVPNTLLNDSAFDIEAWLGKKFAQRFGRGQNTAFTNGAGHGSNTAQGIVPGLQAGANQTYTTAGPTAITYADLLGLEYTIDPAYRANAAFMFSDSAMRVLHALTDANGRPLFVPAGSYGGIMDAQPTDTLLGHRLYTNNDLSPVAATNVTGIFGDFEAAYVIRDVVGMQTVRLTERYADYLQTGFFAFMRTDAIVDDSYAAALLVQHA